MTRYLTIFVTLMMICASSAFCSPPDNADAVIKHLEFLDYTIKFSDKNNIIAKHSSHLNCVIKKYRSGILFTSLIGANENGKKNQSSIYPLVNMLNKKAAASRFYLDKDSDLIIESYYPGAYNKETFEIFMKGIYVDQKMLGEIGTILETYFE